MNYTVCYGTKHIKKTLMLDFDIQTDIHFDKFIICYIVTGQIIEQPHEKASVCISENTDAKQLFSICTADQHLCFRCMESTILLLLLKFRVCNLYLVTEQTGFC